MFRYISLVLCFLSGMAFGQPGIVINEMMSNNETTIADDKGNFEDWLEVFNADINQHNLQGFFLTDDQDDPLKWAFPSILLEPDSFLLVFASGRDTVIGSYLHTNFKINAGGEWIYLYKSGAVLVDSVMPVDLADDISFGRRPDGSDSWFTFEYPTPRRSNNFSNTLSFSHERGYYPTPFSLSVTSDDGQATIRYTLDGSFPGPGSASYMQPLYLGYRYDDPNTISMIPTTPGEGVTDLFHWKAPWGNVDKAHVVRFRSFVDGQPASRTYSMTYLVDSLIMERYPFPVVSIITDPSGFFSPDSGIYVPGDSWDPSDPLWTGNYFLKGEEWKRTAHVEFFNKDGSVGFQQDAQVRIHGKSSRRRPQKSIKFTARSSFGSPTFAYPLFPQRDQEEYNSFILKTTFGSEDGTIIKDALSHWLVGDLPFDVSHSLPAVVFINGEYWGFQDIREEQDEDYLAALYDIDNGPINLLENGGYVLQGSNAGYDSLLTFVDQHDMTDPVNYDHVTTMMDIQNYIDYQIVEIYLNNYDWPGSNIEFWQSPELDERWRWIFFDLDFAWGDPSYNMLEHATLEGGQSWPNPDWSTFLLRNLLQNEQFRSQFIDRFAELLNTLFQTDTIIPRTAEFTARYEPGMEKHIWRFGYPATVESWKDKIDYYILNFASERPCHMEDQIIEFFDLDDFPFSCDSGGLTRQDLERVQLFPNPSSGRLKLITHFIDPVEIEVLDGTGRCLLLDYSPPRPIPGMIEMDLGALANGLYFIRLKGGDHLHTLKLIIQK